MKIWIRWAARAAMALVALVLLAVLGAWVASEAMIRRPWPKSDVVLTGFHAGSASRGARLARLYGCADCHGGHLEGRLFFDEMPVAKIWAPNLTLAAAHQTDADLARAIRTGVAADGRTLWAMPSESFARLSDAETADIIAYVRSRPVTGGLQPAKQIGPVGRIGVLIGKFKSAPQMLAEIRAVTPIDVGPVHSEGRALTRVCMECHGADLKGRESLGAPDLTVAATYDFAGFRRLLRTGAASGNRRLGLMSEVAPLRFNAFSDREILAMHSYLTARAEGGE